MGFCWKGLGIEPLSFFFGITRLKLFRTNLWYFDRTHLFCKIESDLECLKESSLAEKSKTKLVHPSCETCIDWNLNHSLKIDDHFTEVRGDICATDSGSHLNRGD